ncbi:hypothetical protein AGABI1DRAFT_125799 [Agaricus bisporus var. burnettii JB137-S8]|uniref:Xylanolytic transcriptional activator regulatory domain-containing protein n=1 Tax=Agaricus bisporus var. burnettii (strain JB137-S8 / ATCC MYA-4627 / FGSC 10392) TaxID=597362 RepID=K5XDJ1_AGABU|nr:uncharacterized protein AGABI1DRAFT_125799 [Agaricus bisporus var. burnettii JB137-S8]EKM81408.1 hypothetical protein AGABI1DRAFT_125799 [Agaricus bisporus var. burnettii JB137-S8]
MVRALIFNISQLKPSPGSLSTGQGTRFVLAATEHLHQRITHLTTRVRQLEDALAALQAQLSSDPHPLLADDLLADTHDDDPAPMLEDPTATQVIDAFGTLSISTHGISRFFGPTGGSESLLLAQIDPAVNPASAPLPTDSHTLLPELALFSQSFPFTPMGQPADVEHLIKSHLPPWNRAVALADTYFEQVSWIFHGVTQLQLKDDMLPVIYDKQKPIPGEDYSSPHDLALLFMIFAMGALVQAEPSNAQGEHFHQLARAALALQPILEKPSIVTIQTLHLMSIYNAMSGSDLKSETSMEMTWSLITLASHLSQTIGLHRDSARWGLSPKMVQRRRILFWDLFVADVWQSLNTGRPPSFSLPYVDCAFPLQYNESDESEAGFEVWQFRFASECVAEVTSRTLTAEAPSYATIMELDRKVRDFPLPEGLSNPSKNDIGASFQRCVLDHIKETVLMYMHRSFFAQAMIEQPLNPLKSAYAPSFTAAYRAALTILKSIDEQFNLFPNSCSRFWTMWTFAFTAAVIFGTVVTRGPRSPLAQSAMAELEQALVLFTKASKYSIRALKSLPVLTRLAEKARYALANAKASSAGDGWSNLPGEHDELSIFAGHTRFVSAAKGEGDRKSKETQQPSSSSQHTRQPQPPQPRQQPIYGWQHSEPTHFEYPYVPSERTVQRPPQHIEPLTSEDYSQWSTDPVILHPPARVSQPYALPSDYRVQRRQHEDQIGTIELHPAYYPPPSTSTTYTSSVTHTHTSHLPPAAPYMYPPFTSSLPQQHHIPHRQQQQQQPPTYDHMQDVAELAYLGLASRDSRLDERWSSFMADSGLLEGFNYDSNQGR